MPIPCVLCCSKKPNTDRGSRDRTVIATNILTDKKWAAAEREGGTSIGIGGHKHIYFCFFSLLPSAWGC